MTTDSTPPVASTATDLPTKFGTAVLSSLGAIDTKPGWKTSEFYGSWAVKILGALMAGGVFGDGSTAMRIAGAAMTVLGFLGYTYSRTAVKTSTLIMLLGFGLGTSSLTACNGSKSPGQVVVDCTGGSSSVSGIVAEVAALVADWTKPTAEGGCNTPTGIDWGCIESKAISKGLAIGGCAFAEVFSTNPHAPETARAIDPARAALEDFRARVGGATFHTEHGDL